MPQVTPSGCQENGYRPIWLLHATIRTEFAKPIWLLHAQGPARGKE
jgi:hypothetical protein